MKILMINTFPHGGATIAARRQVLALRESGHAAYLLYIEERVELSDIEVKRDEYEIVLMVPASAWSFSGRICKAVSDSNRTSISNTWFSLFQAESFADDVLSSIFGEFDVLHFHWTAHLVSATLFHRLPLFDKKIVITSHDENYYTGGCHYTAGCQNFVDGCLECPQLRHDPLGIVGSTYSLKLNTFNRPDINWVFPSKWLMECFSKSALGDSCKNVHLVRNCIDRDKYFPPEEHIALDIRQRFGFSPSELVFVAGAADNNEARKGFDCIFEAIKNLPNYMSKMVLDAPSVVIVTFGLSVARLPVRSPKIRQVDMGVLDEEGVADIFSVADLLLFPSLEENYSNLILESLHLGCPVAGFRIGGVPEMVEHGVNGVLTPDVTPEGFSSLVGELVLSRELGKLKKSTSTWLESFGAANEYSVVASGLLSIYQSGTSSIDGMLGTTVPIERLQREQNSVLQLFYNELTSRVRSGETTTHSMVANCIRRIIRTAHVLPLTARRDDWIRDTCALGITAPEPHEDFGRVFWLTQRATVLFRAGEGCRYQFVIEAPAIDWVDWRMRESLSRCRLILNGVEVGFEVVYGSICGERFYASIDINLRGFRVNDWNLLQLDFDKPSIPIEEDGRGLCVFATDWAILALPDRSMDLTDAKRFLDGSFVRTLMTANPQEKYLHESMSVVDIERRSLGRWLADADHISSQLLGSACR